MIAYEELRFLSFSFFPSFTEPTCRDVEKHHYFDFSTIYSIIEAFECLDEKYTQIILTEVFHANVSSISII